MDGASKSTLENEFGTSNDDECIIKILEHGNMQESKVRPYPALLSPSSETDWCLLLQNHERQGPKNDSMGPMTSH